MVTLEESLDQFTPPVYGKTRRTPETYQTVANRCRAKVAELIAEYKATKNNQQLLREIRNDIDYYLRRYHEYCIKQRDGMAAHYHEIGADADTDFEHLIPAARIRDLLLAGVLSTEQALNAPTVRLSRNKHKQLGEAGWSSSTPDMWCPFRRYTQVFAADFQTFDGESIDAETWTLEDHYRRFDYLKIAV